MIDLKVSTLIPRPVEEVFAYVADPENWPHWQESVADVQRLNPGPDGPGSRFQYVARLPVGKDVTTTMMVTEVRLLEEIAFKGDWAGPVQPQGSICFEPVGDSTRVTLAWQSRTRGAYRWVEGQASKFLRDMHQQGLERLKALLMSRDRQDTP